MHSWSFIEQLKAKTHSERYHIFLVKSMKSIECNETVWFEFYCNCSVVVCPWINSCVAIFLKTAFDNLWTFHFPHSENNISFIFILFLLWDIAWINERGLGALAIETSLSSSDYLVEFFFSLQAEIKLKWLSGLEII